MEKMNEPSQQDTKAKLISLLVMAVILVTFWYMLNIALMTFILTFIFYHLLRLIQQKSERWLKCQLPEGIMIVVMYILVVLLVALVGSAFAPTVITQVTDLCRMLVNFDFYVLADSLGPQINGLLQSLDFNKYFTEAGVLLATEATKIGGFGVNFLVSLLLSLLLLLEKGEIKSFGEKMAQSKIAFIYEYFMYFGSSFVKTFGEVMKVQVTIAFINAIASVILLSLMGFPQIVGLGFMIFFLGLIPVAGVIISLIPLTIIGFNFGGISKVIGVIIMIVIIHSLEAYILNPKLMSNKTHLPVCFVFIILLVGEHYLGVWGLLIGVPIFMFFMDIFGVDLKLEKRRQSIQHQKISKK